MRTFVWLISHVQLSFQPLSINVLTHAHTHTHTHIHIHIHIHTYTYTYTHTHTHTHIHTHTHADAYTHSYTYTNAYTSESIRTRGRHPVDKRKHLVDKPVWWVKTKGVQTWTYNPCFIGFIKLTDKNKTKQQDASKNTDSSRIIL